jgi:peroxiredoxin
MRISLFAFLAAIALLGAGCSSRERPEAPQARFAALSGESFSTADLRGKVVLVNFWSTSCVSCLKEFPRMIEAYRKFEPRGFETVAVAMSYDQPNQVAEFSQRRGLPFKVAVDSTGEIARSFSTLSPVRVTPTSFLIDKRGRIIRQFVGEPDWAEFHIDVEKALAS